MAIFGNIFGSKPSTQDGFHVEMVPVKLPSAFIDKAAANRIGKIAIAGIVDNVDQQKQADGSPLENNHPATRQKKLDEGSLSLKSLVHRGQRFLRVRLWKKTINREGGKIGNEMSIAIEPKNSRIGGSVAVRRRKSKKTGKMLKARKVRDPTFKQLVEYVQVGGGGRNRYLGWFGISKEVGEAIRFQVAKSIKRAMRKAARENQAKQPKP